MRQKEQLERWAQTQQQELQAMATGSTARQRQLDRKTPQWLNRSTPARFSGWSTSRRFAACANLLPEDQEELAPA